MPKVGESENERAPIILLIEDDTLLSDMYAKKFELESFKVLTAANGEVGLSMAFENDVDLILLDLLLPRIQGIEVLETLRKSEKCKNIPVITLTNLAKEDLRKKAMELGAAEFLVKAQQDPEDVVKIVRRILQK